MKKQEAKYNLKDLTEIIVEFSKKRGWENEDPNQLISSILIELGELAEHYQWKNKFKALSDKEKKIIGYEYVDVIFYLFRLAHNSGIDIEEAFFDKLPKLEKKFPVGQSNEDHKKVKEEYRRSGKNKEY